MSEQKTEKRYGSFWTCPNCEGNPEFDLEAFVAHLKNAHQIDSKNSEGKRTTLMHVDGTTSFLWSYEWEIDGKKFIQNTCQECSPKDEDYRSITIHWR